MTNGSQRVHGSQPSGCADGDRSARKSVNVWYRSGRMPNSDASEDAMINILSSTNPTLFLARLALLIAAIFAFAMASVANAQQSFKTTEEAADALISAAR